jgi:hypothetical protein
MTDMLPFNMSFPAETVVFVVDEYSQYKKTIIDEYCYTHSPIVISEISQLVGKHAPPANRNLLLDCILKWDNAREYNNVADVLRFHTAGLLMTMNKPAAFDPMIRAKVDYLVLFRGRHLRHLRRIYRQYLTTVLDDPTILSGLFKSLGWGEGLVLDLAAMQTSGRFTGNYYKYSSGTGTNLVDTVNSDNTYANLDVALGDWIANSITNSPETISISASIFEPTSEPITEEWEIVAPIDYTLSRPEQLGSIPEIHITEEKPLPISPEITSNTQTIYAIPDLSPELTSTPELIETINNTLPEQQETKNECLEQPSTTPVQQQQGWTSYLYSKAWSLFL